MRRSGEQKLTIVEAVIQVRDGNGQDHSGRTLDVHKEETTGLSNQFGLGCERENAIRDDYKIWGLSY